MSKIRYLNSCFIAKVEIEKISRKTYIYQHVFRAENKNVIENVSDNVIEKQEIVIGTKSFGSIDFCF